MKDALRAPGSAEPGPAIATAAVPGRFDGNPVEETAASLPRDHPAWQRDTCSVSGRTRAVLARLRPVIVRARTFWDHALRAVAVQRGQLSVDPSGCYRLR
ncbi:MAG TPA: hypothetical protein VGD01_06910 [Candidatus Elarobacter sp.]